MAQSAPEELQAARVGNAGASSGLSVLRRSHVVWGLFGFLLGAVFWHVVGFWDFLGGVVYKRQQETTVFERALTLGQRLAEEDIPLAQQERLAHQSAQNCTTLVFDRLSGATTSRPCVVIIRNVPQDVAETAPSSRILQTTSRLDRPAAER